jgi:TPP-dependent pyruvate/acetoin dehydrogenase alpha subunit
VRDPVARFERFLERRGLWDQSVRERLRAEVAEEVRAAAKQAEQTPPPGLETMFTDVYAALPAHLRKQGERLFDLGRRRGEAAAGDGAFPL